MSELRGQSRKARFCNEIVCFAHSGAYKFQPWWSRYRSRTLSFPVFYLHHPLAVSSTRLTPVLVILDPTEHLQPRRSAHTRDLSIRPDPSNERGTYLQVRRQGPCHLTYSTHLSISLFPGGPFLRVCIDDLCGLQWRHQPRPQQGRGYVTVSRTHSTSPPIAHLLPFYASN